MTTPRLTPEQRLQRKLSQRDHQIAQLKANARNWEGMCRANSLQAERIEILSGQVARLELDARRHCDAMQESLAVIKRLQAELTVALTVVVKFERLPWHRRVWRALRGGL